MLANQLRIDDGGCEKNHEYKKCTYKCTYKCTFCKIEVELLTFNPESV